MIDHTSQFLHRLHQRDKSLPALIECSSQAQIRQLLVVFEQCAHGRKGATNHTPHSPDLVQLLGALLSTPNSRHLAMLKCVSLIQDMVIKEKLRFMCMSELHQAALEYDAASSLDQRQMRELVELILHPEQQKLCGPETEPPHPMIEPDEGIIAVLDLLSTLINGRDPSGKNTSQVVSELHPTLPLLFESDSILVIRAKPIVVDMALDAAWDDSLFPSVTALMLDLPLSSNQTFKLSHKIMLFLQKYTAQHANLPSWAIASLLKSSFLFCQSAATAGSAPVNQTATGKTPRQDAVEAQFAQNEEGKNTKKKIVSAKCRSNVSETTLHLIWCWLEIIRTLLFLVTTPINTSNPPHPRLQSSRALDSDLEPSVVLCIAEMSTRHSFELVHHILKYYMQQLESLSQATDSGEHGVPHPFPPLLLPSQLSYHMDAHDLVLLCIMSNLESCRSLSQHVMVLLIKHILDDPKANGGEHQATRAIHEMISLNGMESYGPAILRFAVRLADISQGNCCYPFKGKKNAHLAAQLHQLAKNILLSLFQKQANMRLEILAACFSNLVNEFRISNAKLSLPSSPLEKSTHASAQRDELYCSTLEALLERHLPEILPYAPKIFDWLPYLPVLAGLFPSTCNRILDAVLLLAKASATFQDNVILLFKKTLTSRSPVPCALAHHGLCTIVSKRLVPEAVEAEIFACFHRSLKLPLVIRLPLYDSLLNLLQTVALTPDQPLQRRITSHLQTLVLSRLERHCLAQPKMSAQFQIETFLELVESTVRPKESLFHLVAHLAVLAQASTDHLFKDILLDYLEQSCCFYNFVVPHVLGIKLPLANGAVNTALLKCDIKHKHLTLSRQSHGSCLDDRKIATRPNANTPCGLLSDMLASSYLLLAEMLIQESKKQKSDLFLSSQSPVVLLKALQLLEIRGAVTAYTRHKRGLRTATAKTNCGNYLKQLQSLSQASGSYLTVFSLESTMLFLFQFAQLAKDDDDAQKYCCPSITAIADLLEILQTHVLSWHQKILVYSKSSIDQACTTRRACVSSSTGSGRQIGRAPTNQLWWIPSLDSSSFPSRDLRGCPLLDKDVFCTLLKHLLLAFQVIYSSGPGFASLPPGVDKSPYLEALELLAAAEDRGTLLPDKTPDYAVDAMRRAKEYLIDIFQCLFSVSEHARWNSREMLSCLQGCFENESPEESDENEQDPSCTSPNPRHAALSTAPNSEQTSETQQNNNSDQDAFTPPNTSLSTSVDAPPAKKPNPVTGARLSLYFALVLQGELESGISTGHLGQYMKLITTLSRTSLSPEDDATICSVCELFLDILSRFSFVQFSVIRLLVSFVLNHHPDPVFSIGLACHMAIVCCSAGLDGHDHRENRPCQPKDNHPIVEIVSSLRVYETSQCRMQSLDLCLKHMAGFLRKHCTRKLTSWLSYGTEQALITEALESLIHTSLPSHSMTLTVWLRLIVVAFTLYFSLGKFLAQLRASAAPLSKTFGRPRPASDSPRTTDLQAADLQITETNVGWLSKVILFSIPLRRAIQSKRSLFARHQETRIPALLAKLDGCDILLRQLCDSTSGDLRHHLMLLLSHVHTAERGQPWLAQSLQDLATSSPQLPAKRGRKRRARHFIRSRNAFIDTVLKEEEYLCEDDDYADLEDFIDPTD